MAKPTCESHNSSREQPYTGEEALSEWEINAVMQLIQLSSADSYSDHHQEDDNSSNNNNYSFSSSSEVDRGKPSVDAASSSYSSSSSPVTAVLLITEAEKAELAEEDRGDGGEDRRNFGERRNKRYRSIVELYRVTDDIVLKKKMTKEKEIMQQQKTMVDASNFSTKLIQGLG